jgi:hypothetical protein
LSPVALNLTDRLPCRFSLIRVVTGRGAISGTVSTETKPFRLRGLVAAEGPTGLLGERGTVSPVGN